MKQKISLIYAAAVAIAILGFIVAQAGTFVVAVSSVSAGALASAVLLLLCAIWLQGRGWISIQSTLDPRTDLRGADWLLVFLQGYLGRYLPGKIGLIVGRATSMSGRGYSGALAAYSSLIELAIFLAGYVVVGAVATAAGLLSLSTGQALLFAAASGTLFLLLLWRGTGFVQRSVSWMYQRMRKKGEALPVMEGALAAKIGFLALLTAAAYSISFAAILFPHLEKQDAARLLLSSGSYSLGIGLGIVAVFAPSGIGVREMVPLFFLKSEIEGGFLLSLMILHRILIIFSELLLLAAAFLFRTSRIEETQ